MDDYVSMIGLKTAVLIAASAKLGAVIAGAPHKVADALYDYGDNMGLAFQIKDDYFDSFGNTSVFGKKIGGDILCGKKTWLLVEALKRADSVNAKELHELLALKVSGEEQERYKIDSVIALYKRLEIDKAALEAMDQYNKKALECLGRASLNDKQNERMTEFASALLKREK
jgi:geranylgeranyl diphosphate synthase type II